MVQTRNRGANSTAVRTSSVVHRSTAVIVICNRFFINLASLLLDCTLSLLYTAVPCQPCFPVRSAFLRSHGGGGPFEGTVDARRLARDDAAADARIVAVGGLAHGRLSTREEALVQGSAEPRPRERGRDVGRDDERNVGRWHWSRELGAALRYPSARRWRGGPGNAVGAAAAGAATGVSGVRCAGRGLAAAEAAAT